MGLIVIIAAMLGQHLIHGRMLALPDFWYESVSKKLQQSNAINQLAESWLLVLLPPIALIALRYALDNPPLWFVVDILVLFYAFGAIKIRTFLHQSIDGRLSKQEFKNNLDALALKDDASSQLGWFNHNLVYTLFSRFFVLVFWYVLLGAPMVLLVHLLQLQSFKGANETAMQKALAVVEWFPCQLLTLSFALMGDFVSVLAKFLPFGFNLNTRQELIVAAKAAIDIDQSAVTKEQLLAILELVERCRLLWLVVLAVWFLMP